MLSVLHVKFDANEFIERRAGDAISKRANRKVLAGVRFYIIKKGNLQFNYERCFENLFWMFGTVYRTT